MSLTRNGKRDSIEDHVLLLFSVQYFFFISDEEVTSLQSATQNIYQDEVLKDCFVGWHKTGCKRKYIKRTFA